MRILRTPDANTDGTSSTPSASEGAASTQDAPVESSTTQQTEPQGESFENTLAEGFKEALKKEGEAPTPEAEAEVSDPQQLKKTEGQEAEPEVKEGEQATTENEPGEGEEQGPVPYERFQEVVAERNEVKQRIVDLEPKAQAHERVLNFCQENGISNDDFVQAMEIAALLKQNPVAAREKLAPIMEGLGLLSGDTLPADLSKDVEDGAITLERAKEIATLRAQAKFSEQSTKLTAKQQADRQQQEFLKSVHTAWVAWDTGKRKLDPDFKPGGNGLWELVNDRLSALGAALGPNGQPIHPIRTAQDAVKLAEQAYEFVMKTAKRVVPKAGQHRALSSNGSGRTTKGSPLEAKTVEEALQRRAKELGIV